MAHCYNPCISKHMKLKLGSNIIRVYLKFVKKLMLSSLFLFLWRHCQFYDVYHLKIQTSPIFILSSSNLVWGVAFGSLISNFNSKTGQNIKFWRKKAWCLSFWSCTVSIDGHRDSKETSILKLLVLKGSLYNYITKFGEDWLSSSGYGGKTWR